jgi:hypothetical protein
MNVALTRCVSLVFTRFIVILLRPHFILFGRAKHFLFIVARRRSIMANHYWRQLVEFARERNSLIHVPIDHRLRGMKETNPFPELTQLAPDKADDHGYSGESDYSA